MIKIMNCINKLRENVLVRNLNFGLASGRGLIIALVFTYEFRPLK
jgi:hypothetical protein